MPRKVELSGNRQVTYLYDAAGVKHQVTHQGGDVNSTTDYCGSVIYENGALSRILTDEGYITLTGTTPVYHYYLRDHLGNNRVVVNQDGTTVEQVNHYYPMGGLFDETAADVQPYKFNGKELDGAYGLDWYDYAARYMEPGIGRFTAMDPMAEKCYGVSPYVYGGNNPVRFVDPTGNDWYEDKKGMMQYDPQITKDSELPEGETYVGVTHQVTNSKGRVIENYRKDGSIMYANETDAYNRMWNQASTKNIEESGYALKNGKVLVMPDYNNKNDEVDISDYGYSVHKNMTLSNNSSELFNLTGNIHTHQDPSLPATPSFLADNGFGDVGHSMAMGGLPVIVIGHDGKVHGTFYSVRRKGYEPIPGFGSRKNLLSGKTTLLPWLNAYPTKNR